jgi:lipopolysaccharide export system permease protein
VVLNDGRYYEDLIVQNEDRNKLPFAWKRLQKYTINIDLSQLNKVDMNDQNIANTNTMLTVNELKYLSIH